MCIGALPAQLSCLYSADTDTKWFAPTVILILIAGTQTVQCFLPVHLQKPSEETSGFYLRTRSTANTAHIYSRRPKQLAHQPVATLMTSYTIRVAFRVQALLAAAQVVLVLHVQNPPTAY